MKDPTDATPAPQQIRIVLIEDHAVMRMGLRMLLESMPGLLVVGEAATGVEAMALVASEQPDLILLDLDLGPERGVDLLPNLLAKAQGARVLILTGLRSADEHRQAIRGGAMGLVLKEQAPEVLLKAIEKVYAGEVWLDRSTLATILSEMTTERFGANSVEDARIITLTEREREVIALICEGLKNKQIGDRLSISETTVRHHLTSIFAKLGVDSRLELVIFTQRHNLTRLSN